MDAAFSVLTLALLAGAVLAVSSPLAHADTSDGTLTVIVNRDEDGDHGYDPAIDGPQPGIQITVTDASGASVRGITDDDGHFVLHGTNQLDGGRYTVTAEIPPNLSELVPVPASDTYASFVTTVDVSTSSQTVRLGVAPRPAPTVAATAPTVGPPPTVASRPPRFAVGDRVWRDLNRSGVQDPSEPPAAKVSVQLVGLDGEIVDSTVSAASGRYLFDNLPAGSYTVRFAGVPSGSRLTTAGSGGDRGADSDPDYAGETPPFSLGVGEPNVRAAAAADRVAASYINPTIDAGITALRYAVGDCVWLDLDGDGAEDSDEPPAAATVTLLTEDTVVARTRTDAQGEYLFSNLEAGDYQVVFSDLGEHRAFTARQAGPDPSLDSDPDPRTGETQVITLGPGAADLVPAGDLGVADADLVNLTISAGLLGVYSLGDTVWRDENGNGLRDAGDAGVAYVKVELLDERRQVLATTTTSPIGSFAFEGLAAGPYQLRFWAAGTGLLFTSQHIGMNSAVDSDADPTGLTQTVVLGEENPADTTIDAGLTTPGNFSAPPTSTEPTAVPVDTELSSTGGVALPIPIAGLALVASGVSCLLAGRRNPTSRP
jgi:serine-aspartate repeat-containing protein C/D/E